MTLARFPTTKALFDDAAIEIADLRERGLTAAADVMEALVVETKMWRSRYVTMRQHRDQALVDLRQYEARDGSPRGSAA
jgi:hypothetical protein